MRLRAEQAEAKKNRELRGREQAEGKALELAAQLQVQESRLANLEADQHRRAIRKAVLLRMVIGVIVAGVLFGGFALASWRTGWPHLSHPHRAGIWWTAGWVAAAAGWATAGGPHLKHLAWVLPIVAALGQLL